ncbi:CLUMA_CG007580, isoform A [Clunio marinus]|uniref:CLUMA_CG007580, isoform A n=1 Tax=Clunio marinus TaxID=568069 RepID=A0A1J1I147_9DIPT|nr:CLUMA_CG007580, isoform A [Clunio marinus]
MLMKLSFEEEINAKVEPVNPSNETESKNSTIKYIKYTNNGYFYYPPSNKLNHTPSNHVGLSQKEQVSTQCGGIFRNLQNLIEAPKFITPRPICNLRCEYQIVSPYICENEFHVQFLDFAIDSSKDCENDRVIINYSEVLCGKIIGVKKFKTKGGVLNITFSSKMWDLKQGKGFRLLVTRLPCVEETNENQSEVDTLEPNYSNDEDPCFRVNSSYSVSGPNYNSIYQVYGVPGVNYPSVTQRQDIPITPLPPPTNPPVLPPIYPPTNPPIYPPNPPPTRPPVLPPIQPPIFPPIYPPIQPPILPPQFLPQCCRNIYNQQRFLLISQGFPAYVVTNNDCIFAIQRSSPDVCKLRIIFKYFLLDDPQSNQFGCVNNFIEIDGQRICGCKTNFVYETLWGYEPKIIRLRTLPGTFIVPQGFVFDVIQEPCPFKIQENVQADEVALRQKRFFSHDFFPKPLIGRNFPIHSQINKIKSDIDESFRSKFYASDPNYVNNVCTFNSLTLFNMKLETIGIPKEFCFAY